MIGPEHAVSVVMPYRISGHRARVGDSRIMLTPPGEHSSMVALDVFVSVNSAAIVSPATVSSGTAA